jgi:hypothetical protein
MRKFSIKQKVAAGLGAGAIVLAGGGVAFAFWSTSGSGAGTATTATGASDLTVTQISAPSDLAPGVAAEGLSVDVLNNATNNATVAQVSVSIASVTKALGATGSCDSTDYTLGGVNPMTNGAGDLAHNGLAHFSGATLGFNNKGTNQDGCKGATVNLSYAVS